ncbi:serologically defined colon cancer antigen 1 [Ophiostoma piceae UAMH 11346]|uniref:Ribosome quality control complex subunit 2 n=1 Tax=Ophiostoma piceae (strain UAMH 11346) TaxID=1262450 RepID=S3BTP7_OPHP1|nr:serologically defined colon cancer antigen 1 [Ophiostoma piceae UAMH 11346]
MKQRFSSLDVRAISHELNASLVGTRISNVYDLIPPSASSGSSSASSSRTILLRFSKNQDKYQLVVDSGFRCHLTAYDARAASGAGGAGAGNAPSTFVSRLRSFLNGRFVSGVSQVGVDRIIELRFSDGQFRLYLEFFAAGNIVLTDAASKVLALQRTVAAFRSASLDVTLNVNSTYAIGARQNAAQGSIPPLSLESVREVLEKAIAADAPRLGPDGKPLPSQPKKKKKQSLSRTLGMHYTDLAQVLIDHWMLVTNFDTVNKASPADILADEGRLKEVLKVLEDARSQAEGFTKSGPKCPGVIIATKKKQVEGEVEAEVEHKNDVEAGVEKTADDADAAAAPPAPSANANLDFIDFHPFSPRQFENDPEYIVLHFESFNKTADEFYSHLQGLKANRQVHQQESMASKKLEATKRDQAQRIETLQEQQQRNVRKAAAIEANQDWVQAALDAINEQLQQGVDWENLGHIIENSANSNPVAAMFKLPLHIAEGYVTLTLDENPEDGWEEEFYEDEEADYKYDENEQERSTLDVDVKLALSAWGNAREYYDQKRVAAVKEQKTKEVTSMALRNAEKKVAEELKRVQAKTAASGKPGAPQLIRRPQWFEKFAWFVSSDGYLVLAAKDPQQCEMLYRRYFSRNDIYVHADIKGSPGIVAIKNRTDVVGENAGVVPPATLAQAGCLAVCASEAWETKAGMGAYWVRADQVSKATSRGEILPPGVFDIRGEKNHMPPPQRVLGFGVMFKISDASKGNHTKHQILSIEEITSGAGDEDEEEEEAAPEAAHEQAAAEVQEETTEEPAAEDTTPEENVKDEDEEVEAKEEQELEEETALAAAPEWKGKGREHLRSTSPTPSRASTTNSANAISKRTLKAKAKKLAKYKDQDEDERVAAERLFGVAAGREKAEAKAKAKAQREAEAAAYEERRRAQKEKQMQKMRDFEAARQAKLEAGDADPGDAGVGDADEGDDPENGSLDVLTSIVGRPAPGDEILEIIPVCAPWMALSRLKYKVKLQPGQIKKGRAARDMLERWKRAGESTGGKVNTNVVDVESRDPERIWPRETELFSGMKMEEAANCMPVGKVTIMLGGGMGGSGGGKGGGKAGGKGSGRGSKSGKKR